MLNLYDNAVAIGQPGSMDLPDRRGRDWCLLELAKQFVQRKRQFRFDGLPHDRRWIRGNIGLQLFQFVGQGASNEVRSRAEELPQLDEGRPKVRQRQTNAGLARVSGQYLTVAILELVLGEVNA